MRLLSSSSGEMKFFPSRAGIPPYAILSHTWEEEEVSFQDWQGEREKVKKVKGFRKIEYCCQQAVKDGFDWVWVDTCCIDKTSSAELSESINSMFRWYKEASVCYAYLADVKRSPLSTIESQIAESHWFERGWTLQELIASKNVIFYSEDWCQIGTKLQLSTLISSITGIEETYLDSANIQNASIAQRMSWAANRKTTREEDIAYCLLGIFDVNMPLLYGEGERAFLRLQEALVKAYPEDHTLFAWGTIVERFSGSVLTDAQILGYEPIEYNPEGDGSLLGLLAKSPADFKSSGKFICHWDYQIYFRAWQSIRMVPTVVGSSIHVELPMFKRLKYTEPQASHDYCSFSDGLPVGRLRETTFAILTCGYYEEKGFMVVAIPLIVCSGSYGRTQQIVINESTTLKRYPNHVLHNAGSKIIVERQPCYQPHTRDIVVRRFVSSMTLKTLYIPETIEKQQYSSILKEVRPTRGAIMAFLFQYDFATGLVICISRVGERHNGTDKLHFVVRHIDATAAIEDSIRKGERHQGYADQENPERMKLVFTESQYSHTYDALNYVCNNWDRIEGGQTMGFPQQFQVAGSRYGPSVRIATERIYIGGDPEQPIDIVDIIIQPELNQPRLVTDWEGKLEYENKREEDGYTWRDETGWRKTRRDETSSQERHNLRYARTRGGGRRRT
ncbi:HET-domain-containing protein [Daldinia vernicosa]|uniref:HET-domain-containing protein n=1 Tax=Daldinia vernicosa TaxID=114800 RepID=UPI002008B5CA|nr:HET-domain-containing protein [Daldinia vernicosa]KAI0849257.1 HET-domain-containing protein [Daldinia vernicosa]